MDNAQRREMLADFLRTRRARLSPGEVNLPAGRRRRTAGLRREEVAELANIGTSWYTSLEQGRDISPSAEVLDSLARALRLTDVERQHLFLLAGQASASLAENAQEEEISPILLRILEDLNPDPAYIMDWRWNYVAWNAAASALGVSRATPPYDSNIVWRVFASRPEPASYSQWAPIAQKILAEFRAESTQYADDEWLQQLIADLHRVSPEFREWWPRQDVRGRSDGMKEFDHPLVGRLLFEHTTLQVSANPGLKIMIYRPCAGTDTASKLSQLLCHSAHMKVVNWVKAT
ncbi:MAG TPA: helix-turn-helix transcriptional regulator [Ktedonosporobacter sp.]|nr:helix-turn-helix transcriptional regulator [Ktedonosporobacter sp.]